MHSRIFNCQAIRLDLPSPARVTGSLGFQVHVVSPPASTWLVKRRPSGLGCRSSCREPTALPADRPGFKKFLSSANLPRITYPIPVADTISSSPGFQHFLASAHLRRLSRRSPRGFLRILLCCRPAQNYFKISAEPASLAIRAS